MGIAAYNRSSNVISTTITLAARRREFVMMDMLNALPKAADARTPFGGINFVHSHGGWFAECPTTGYGFFYKSLRAAVQQWNVAVTGYTRGGVWTSVVQRPEPITAPVALYSCKCPLCKEEEAA